MRIAMRYLRHRKDLFAYNVIFLNMQEFASQSQSMEDMLGLVRRSVISAMQFHKFQYYWNQTETFEALRTYIDMNFEGIYHCSKQF